MEKKFTVAGTASQHGITKVRFANDLVSRTKILIKNNCENINLVELPEPMTKLEALKYLDLQFLPDFYFQYFVIRVYVCVWVSLYVNNRVHPLFFN